MRFLCLMTLALAVSAQQATFTTSTQLVVETVTVTDKKGAPIEGLTAKDFTLTEDGVPQPIRVFEYQRVTALPLAKKPTQVTVYEKLSKMRITVPRPGDTRYKDRRLLALYFDMSSMPEADQLRALSAAAKFVRTQMTEADRMAILRYTGGAIEVLQDFTADTGRLLSILETMMVGEGKGFGESSDDANKADTGAAFGQDDSEFNVFNTDRQLSALQTAAKMLGQLNEKKSLIYFASGMRLNGMNNQAQFRATVNAAVRAGVSFWPVDARGLVAEAPLGDPTRGSSGTVAMYSGTGAMAVTTALQQSQDTLYSLAADTGGKALLDSNDLARGVQQAAAAISSYYLIGYYTTNTALNGKFRRVRITVNPALSAKLDYRQGYFAGKEFGKFNAAEKERQLEDALMLEDPITELTIAMEIDHFQLNRAEYWVPVTVKIPGRELALAKHGGAERTVIDFVGEIKTSYGSTITNVRDKVSVKLSEATAAELARRPIIYDTGFTLLPGAYTIKFLARDAETGRIGTYQAGFVVPNLNQEERRVAMSSVVLSSQRVPSGEALYDAAKSRNDAVNPLVRAGEKLVPSVTRVFRRDQTLSVYLQTYQNEPVLATVSFYRNGEKVFETEPSLAQTSRGDRLRTVPLEFQVALNTLAPGSYDCQVNVLAPSDRKAAFWRAPIMIVP